MITTLFVKLVFGIYAEFDWTGEIEVEENIDLEDLHLAIQKAVDFENDHLYEFYIARTVYSSERVRFDGEDEGSLETRLSELFPLPKNRKLFYWFDYGDDWKFQISRSRKKPKAAEAGVKYPRLVSEKGQKPTQYPAFDDFE